MLFHCQHTISTASPDTDIAFFSGFPCLCSSIANFSNKSSSNLAHQNGCFCPVSSILNSGSLCVKASGKPCLSVDSCGMLTWTSSKAKTQWKSKQICRILTWKLSDSPSDQTGNRWICESRSRYVLYESSSQKPISKLSIEKSRSITSQKLRISDTHILRSSLRRSPSVHAGTWISSASGLI